jgi:hypothetical protein
MNTPANGPQRPSEPRTPVCTSTETPAPGNEPHTGAQRIRLDDLTSDQLDILYDLLEALIAAGSAREAERGALYGRIEVARDLHQPMRRGGSGVYCAHCSHWDGRRVLGVLTDYPCDTLRALDGPHQPDAGPTEAPPAVSTAPQEPAHAPGGSADAGMRPEPPREPEARVHAYPRHGSGLTPCCGRTPFELPRDDRMTEDPARVTCRHN